VVRCELVNMFGAGGPTGSDVAVVPDATRLSAGEMASIAAQVGTDETAFVVGVYGDDAYSVRIFRPDGESPFGGHAAPGTAVALLRHGALPAGRVVQHCGPRAVQVDLRPDEQAVLVVEAPGECRDGELDELLAVSGLAEGDAATGRARLAGFGIPFHYLPVVPGAVSRSRVDLAGMARRGLGELMVFSWDTARRVADARLFAPGYGMPEDRACGPAALGLGVWLVDAGLLPATDGRHGYVVRQGPPTGGRAVLRCSVTVAAGRATGGTARGRVVVTGWGEVTPEGVVPAGPARRAPHRSAAARWPARPEAAGGAPR
jgi:trans-2,3-dihydro-3-hydroxyanthranilate isomerase